MVTIDDSSERVAANNDKPTDQKCVSVIFNPVSGRSDPEERKRRIAEALGEHGYRCQYLVTTPKEGARQFAEQALRDGADLVAVSGGDGTVLEAMIGLIGSGVPLAVFPAGTGNLLSVNLGLPRDVPQAVHAALFGNRRALDLARIVTPDNDSNGGEDQYFAIVAGAGYDASIIRDADREAKNRMGIGAYLWAAIRNLRRRPIKAEIRIDGSSDVLRRRAKSVMVANMGRLQGSLEVIPGAKPDDGQLDVVILKAETLPEWIRLTWNALRHRLREETTIEYFRARTVDVRLSKPQPMQFDGEVSPVRHRSFRVEIVPKAVEVMVPRDAPV